jgi:3',5'-cyclic-AMP phosphodiesterase
MDSFRKFIVQSLLIGFLCFRCTYTENKTAITEQKDGFAFVFMTDIHFQPEHNYSHLPQDPEYSPHKAISMVIDTVNKLKADFVIIGGDLVFDAMRGQKRADSLYAGFKNATKNFAMPVHHVIGNHDLFGIYKESNISRNDPEFKYGKYQRQIGNTYYSFDHKGWHFIILNSLDEKDQRYIGMINEDQKLWLKDDLANVGPNTPIVVATHLPFISTLRQFYPRQEDQSMNNDFWIHNRNEILDMFDNYNLKLVLQGHLHWVEEVYIYEKDTRFLTGGSIAGRPSWRGIRKGEPPGFLLINVENQNVSWSFIDYGWQGHIANCKKVD